METLPAVCVVMRLGETVVGIYCIGRSPQLFFLSSYLSPYARLPSSASKLQPRHRVKEAEERENVSKDILADDSRRG
jgi:hypothetical protein